MLIFNFLGIRVQREHQNLGWGWCWSQGRHLFLFCLRADWWSGTLLWATWRALPYKPSCPLLWLLEHPLSIPLCTSEVSSAPRKHSAHMCSLWLDVHATRPAYQLKHCSWFSSWTAGWRTGCILGTALFTTTLGKYQLGGNLISRNSILITTGDKRDDSHLIFFTKF